MGTSDSVFSLSAAPAKTRSVRKHMSRQALEVVVSDGKWSTESDNYSPGITRNHSGLSIARKLTDIQFEVYSNLDYSSQYRTDLMPRWNVQSIAFSAATLILPQEIPYTRPPSSLKTQNGDTRRLGTSIKTSYILRHAVF